MCGLVHLPCLEKHLELPHLQIKPNYFELYTICTTVVGDGLALAWQTLDLNCFPALSVSAEGFYLLHLRLLMPLENWQNEQIFLLHCFLFFFPLSVSSLHLSLNIWKKPRLAVNPNNSVLLSRQCIQSVYKQIYMFMPARWISSFLLATAQLYKPCLSNWSCVCTHKLSMVGTVPWCWDQGRWK